MFRTLGLCVPDPDTDLHPSSFYARLSQRLRFKLVAIVNCRRLGLKERSCRIRRHHVRHILPVCAQFSGEKLRNRSACRTLVQFASAAVAVNAVARASFVLGRLDLRYGPTVDFFRALQNDLRSIALSKNSAGVLSEARRPLLVREQAPY